MIKNVYRSSSKVPLFLSDFNETWIFSADFPLKKMSWKDANCELSHSKQTDMMQVKVTFHSFKNAPNYWMNFDKIC